MRSASDSARLGTPAWFRSVCRFWVPAGDTAPREIVRQQWNFEPSGSTSESEDYEVELPGVAALELHIVPDISGGSARASLAELRLA